VILIVDRIFVFALWSCAVAVTGRVAAVQQLYNKYVNLNNNNNNILLGTVFMF